MILSEILSSFVAKPTAEVSTVVCGADTAGSLAGDSWKFTVTDIDGNDVTYQPYYVVNGAGADPAVLPIIGIPVAIATGAANTVVATATKAAMEAVVNVRNRMSISLATATLTLTNKRKGVVSDTVDVSTGWTITGGVTQGAETETTNMVAAAAANYFYQPPETKQAKIHFLTLCLSDSAVTTGTSFGALAGLTNGFNINVCSWDGTVLKTIQGPIKTNSQLLGIGLGSALGATYLQVMMDLTAFFGEEIRVNGALGEYIEMDVNDATTGLDGFYMQVSGALEDVLD
jgi:hypothetical protein